MIALLLEIKTTKALVISHFDFPNKETLVNKSKVFIFGQTTTFNIMTLPSFQHPLNQTLAIKRSL